MRDDCLCDYIPRTGFKSISVDKQTISSNSYLELRTNILQHQCTKRHQFSLSVQLFEMGSICWFQPTICHLALVQSPMLVHASPLLFPCPASNLVQTTRCLHHTSSFRLHTHRKQESACRIAHPPNPAASNHSILFKLTLSRLSHRQGRERYVILVSSLPRNTRSSTDLKSDTFLKVLLELWHRYVQVSNHFLYLGLSLEGVASPVVHHLLFHVHWTY